MDKPVEFYLASIWKYQDAGVEAVLSTLRAQHPNGEYSFEADNSLYKVVCEAAAVRSIQETFREIHREIESGVMENKLPPENPLLIAPSPGEISAVANNLATPAAAAAAAADLQCPVAFDGLNYTKVWTRVKNETPDTTPVYAVISADDKLAITAASGVKVDFDTAGRLVYLGGPTADALEKASSMLDNMFNRFLFVMPQPKHLLYAEVEGTYHVDARFMAHVNENMLTSTILDPGQYPDIQLDQAFQAIFATAACLRICLYDQAKRCEVSLFGPKIQPTFSDPVRRWPMWFKSAEYAPKLLGVTAPSKERKALLAPDASRTAQPSSGQAEPPEDGNYQAKNGFPGAAGNSSASKLKTEEPNGLPLAEQLDLLAVQPQTPDTGAASTTSPITASAAVSPPAPLPPAPLLPPEYGNSYQLRMIWEFGNSISKKANKNDSGPTSSSGETATVGTTSHTNSCAVSGSGDSRTDQLITTSDDDEGKSSLMSTAAKNKETSYALITIDEPALQQVPSGSTKTADSVSKSSSPRKALVRRLRTSFVSSLCRCISGLLADLPYSKGLVRLQADLGRIYIMDASSEGLAYNAPGEPSNGWLHTEIVNRLDTVCVSHTSVLFTKALSIFANDIEAIIGPDPPPANLIEGSEHGIAQDLSPEWSFQGKRVIYEVMCQRHVLTSNGSPKPQGRFFVEIDGTEPGAFTYRIRHVDDNRPPIWVHCIRRHWDARVVVSYSQTEKLEKEYGDFARELLRTMVVPPSPITSPKFQISYDDRETNKDGGSFITKILSARVRNVGRFISANNKSFLDVSWNRHMSLQMKPSKQNTSVGTMLATPAADEPKRGAFASWYEASVVSAKAEAAFRENETLPVGGEAAWGRNGAEQEEMFEATFGPALQLVQKMDGVGIIVDNGHGGTHWTPPTKAQASAHSSASVPTEAKRFW